MICNYRLIPIDIHCNKLIWTDVHWYTLMYIDNTLLYIDAHWHTLIDLQSVARPCQAGGFGAAARVRRRSAGRRRQHFRTAGCISYYRSRPTVPATSPLRTTEPTKSMEPSVKTNFFYCILSRIRQVRRDRIMAIPQACGIGLSSLRDRFEQLAG